MAVAATTSTTSSTSTTSTATYTNPWANASTTSSSDSTLNYNDFLQLLISEMSNQDPTDPMDSTSQITQLATYSQVEQSIKTNTLLQSMLQSEALTRAGDLVGKAVTSADGDTTGTVSSVKVNDASIVLTTSSGNTVNLTTGTQFANGS